MQGSATLNGQAATIVESLIYPKTNTYEVLITIGNTIKWVKISSLSNIVWYV